jgi:hypothetical protein
MLRRALVALLVPSLFACAPMTEPLPDEDTSASEKPFSSARATLVTFEFDGMLTAPWQAESKTTKLIKDQLIYTVGQLNAHDSVARLDKVVLSNVKRVDNGDGWMRVTYHATLPVGWGEVDDIPETFDLTFPRKIGPQSLAKFTTDYGPACSDAPSDVTSGNYWYHFRPAWDGCAFDPARVSTTSATVTVSSENTTGRFPEYDRVWEDGALRVVAVFGKYDDYATSPSDAGIRAYDEFLGAVRNGIGSGFATTPANLATSPGVSAPDVTFTGTLEDGRAVVITALLIDSPKVATATFDARYAALTKQADLVLYNGHAGLGANVKALAQKGQFTKGRYTLFFFNGCDTFAYLDETLSKRFAALNPDDPAGTKYLDIATNLMPAYFHAMPEASLALVGALSRPDDPKTYPQIFAKIDAQQVVVVTGEEDNSFTPSTDAFDGIDTTGSLSRGEEKRFETPMLAPGNYQIKLSETKPSAAGDVDLHVGVGYAPTTQTYDHRPYLYGSNESVTVVLDQPSKLYIMLRGYEEAPVAKSGYRLIVE